VCPQAVVATALANDKVAAGNAALVDNNEAEAAARRAVP
jgi:hypothetical protein